MADYSSLEICIPQPIQIAIDDVGWRRGRSDRPTGGPYRTGISRDHVKADYEAIAQLGEALGMRPQAGLILCEWDKHNRLAKVPTSTWLGADWHTRDVYGDWADAAADVLRANRDKHLEITLHGTGHEYWGEGGLSRAEWHDKDGNMRPREQVEAHLDAFEAIMNDHDLGGFPKSYIPCSFYHHFGHPTQNHAAILAKRGVTSISTPFRTMAQSADLVREHFGFDNGLITVERGNDLCGWDVIGPATLDEPALPIIGMHWPNILHENPQRNGEVVNRWVRVLSDYGRRFERTLSPSTDAFNSQLVHESLSTLQLQGDKLILDVQAYFAQPWKETPQQPVIVKLSGPEAVVARDEGGKSVKADSITSNGTAITTLQLPVTSDEPRRVFTLRPRMIA